MMNHIFAWLIIVSAVWGICQGHSSEVSSAILTSGGETVRLLITLTGAMTVWSGLMAVAEASGLSARIAFLLRPVTRRLMPGLREGGEAEQYICLNIAANLLGLGNAATPPGLRAMHAIRQETCPRGTSASAEMITFVVLNTASLQLLPTTLLVLRTEAGAAHPTEILPCVWLSSLAALTAGLTMSFVLRSIGGNAPKKLSHQTASRAQKERSATAWDSLTHSEISRSLLRRPASCCTASSRACRSSTPFWTAHARGSGQRSASHLPLRR